IIDNYNNNISIIIILLNIYSSYQNNSITETESTYANKQYSEFKKAVAEAVTTKLTPIQERYETLIHSDELDDILRDGAKKANEVANETLQIAKQKMGI